jgi:hypothetical protein
MLEAHLSVHDVGGVACSFFRFVSTLLVMI